MTRSPKSSRAENGGGVEGRARDFLTEVEAELKPLSIALNLADWEASTTGTSEAQEKAAQSEAKLRKYLSCPVVTSGS